MGVDSDAARNAAGDPSPNAAAGWLRPGRNCWRIGRAGRLALLIDGDAYYSALAAAFEQAQQSILVLGWDFDRRTRLRRDAGPHRYPSEVARLLDTLVRERRGLQVHILVWDFAMIYALERELLPKLRLALSTHRRFHFRLDKTHPLGASHHQKLVVIDDALAFAGGFDIARGRWDTPEHSPDEPRRINPEGDAYPPFHDVQALVDGEVAASLGKLARERWYRGTGERLRAPHARKTDAWPPEVSPDALEVPVAIARTVPAYRGWPEVREVEALYLDTIRAARHYIYIENQYFTSEALGRALMARLREPEGPEVVLVLPERSSGWLEETTMDVLRLRLLRRLREADAFGRLRVYAPFVPGLGAACINVHSKTMVVDGRFLRVGSSNTSNRSMGLDTECDLALDAAVSPRLQEAVGQYLARLLGEHLAVEPPRVGRTLQAHGSLIATIEALRQEGRTLRELAPEGSSSLDELVPDAVFLDPERPVKPERLIHEYIPEEMRMPGLRISRRFLALLAVLLLLAAVWRWTPLSQYVDVGRLAELVQAMRHEPAAWLAIGAGFVIGSLLMIPLTLLIIATAIALGPGLGFVYALGGSLLSAALAFGAGKVLGRDTVRHLAGARINRLSDWIASQGIVSVVAVRLIPVAPFTLVNLVAGASPIRLRDFIIGTVLGLVPGLVAMVWFADSLARALRQPTLESVLVLLAAVAFIVAAGVLVQRWLARREQRRERGTVSSP